MKISGKVTCPGLVFACAISAGNVNQWLKYNQYLLSPMPTEIWVKFRSPQNSSGAS